MAEIPVSTETAETALADVPVSTDRSGHLAVPSSKATESELRQIERALMHPPAKVNWGASCTSFLSAAYVATKAFDGLNGAADGNAVVFVLSILVMGGVVAVTWQRAREKHPHHEAALADVRRLIAMQSSKP